MINANDAWEKKWNVFENYLENNPQNAKYAVFTTETSHEQVAKASCQST